MNDLDRLRHSTAHLLAAAVLELYPNALPTIGPPIENGFYYDFDNLKISEEDFPKIEEKMRSLVKNWEEFTLLRHSGRVRNPYKQELIDELKNKNEKITFYKSGNFVDLCVGPHIDGNASQKIKFFKLLKLAGAYWQGSEKNKMLTRIYGTAFYTQKELDDYLTLQEEIKKRDHRKIGKDLDLFTFSELVGGGFPLYTPKGALIRRLINDYVEAVQSKLDFHQVWTPQVAKADLFKISGHYDKYKDSMFRVVSNYSDEEFYLKPMNCPQHTQIYASRQRSYRDLPLRYTDFAMLYRDEKPGELNGLARVRAFSQDDCHIFCREDQVDFEIDQMFFMIKEIMKTFSFKYRYRLSTRDPQHPEKYLGDPKTWDRVEKWAVEIVKRNQIDYYDGPGEAAFYAPKMDLMATDALGREWQLSTVQIDFVMPERFNLTYIDKDGAARHPVMLHRAIVGSPERFLMILLEHFAGALPTWLNPVQIAVLPITDRHLEYAREILTKLKENNIRAELDSRAETLSAKIRDWQMQKVPYMLIIGDKEAKAKKITYRSRAGRQISNLALDEFIKNLKLEIENKTLT